jgi:hypothetical protein
VQPLSGGRNNAAYRWESPDGPVCVKVYRVDDRRRAEREWLSLAFLASHHVASAPLPLWAAGGRTARVPLHVNQCPFDCEAELKWQRAKAPAVLKR